MVDESTGGRPRRTPAVDSLLTAGGLAAGGASIGEAAAAGSC